MIQAVRCFLMLLSTLATIVATLTIGRAPAYASNAFCAASIRVWAQASPSNYLVSLQSAAKDAVDARVTFITKSDAWSATIHATPEGTASSTGDRDTRPQLVYVPAGERVEYAYVDGVAIDGGALSDCATMVQGVEESGSAAFAGAGGGVMAKRLEALPPLSCGSIYTPGKAVRVESVPVGDYHTRAVTLVKITIDSNGRVVEASIYKSSGIDGIDDAARAAAINGRYEPPTFLCQRVPGVYLVRMQYSG